MSPHGNSISTLVLVCITIASLWLTSSLAFDDQDVDDDFHRGLDSKQHHRQQPDSHGGATRQHMPRDKVLLSEVKTLTFQRNKRTTSRRTHTIPQLSCVGGTAGCKLFTTDLVECENAGSPDTRTTHVNQINWRCRADISERVRFNHVEVICEGYDYPEDDYILVGSCGLEFTLDYADPHDYHDNSYFKHMDDHEKELHHDRVRKEQADDQQASGSSLAPSTASVLLQNSYLIGVVIVLSVLVVTLVRYCLICSDGGKKASGKLSNRKQAIRSYGPLTSAVMTTKKAC